MLCMSCVMRDVLVVQETCGPDRTGSRSRTGCVCVLCMSLCVVYESVCCV